MRPHTLLNVATSIDGKITTQSRDLHAFGGKEDQDLVEELRASADAVMIGAGTLRDEDPLLTIRSKDRIEKRARESRSAQPHAVVVSSSLNFPVETSRFFTCPGVRKLVCTADDAPAALVERVAQFTEIIKVPANAATGLDLALISARLAALGVKRLLLEGGGILNFAMIAAGLVDEFYVTICPMIFGGAHAPTAVDGSGFCRDTLRSLQLVSVRRAEGGRLFLHYKS